MAVHPDHPSPRPTRSMPVIETHRGLLVHARHTLHDGPAHDGPAHDGPAAPTAHSPSLLWPAFTATAHLTSSCAQYYRHPPLLQPTCWPATAPCPLTCSPPAPTYACSTLASYPCPPTCSPPAPTYACSALASYSPLPPHLQPACAHIRLQRPGQLCECIMASEAEQRVQPGHALRGALPRQVLGDKAGPAARGREGQ